MRSTETPLEVVMDRRSNSESGTPAATARRNRPGQLDRWLALAAAALPWTWYLWRDIGGGLSASSDLQSVADLASLLAPVWVSCGLVVLLALAVVRRSLSLAGAVGAWVAFAAAAVVGPWLPHDGPRPEDPVRIVFANLRGGNTSLAAPESLLAQDAAILITSETNGAQFEMLAERLGAPDAEGGTGEVCSLEGSATCSELNVWSELPIRVAGDQSVARALRGLRLEVVGPGGPFVLYALHSPSPAPFTSRGGRIPLGEHRRRLDALREAASSERLPVVIAGDLNMADRLAGYRAFEGHFHDAMRAGLAQPTSVKWYLRPLLLRIDHVFTSAEWCSADPGRFSVSGSDHLGIRVEVGPCPRPEPPSPSSPS